MRYLLTLVLLGIAITGCSSQPGTDKSAKDVHPGNPDIANRAPEGHLTEEVPPDKTASSLPVTTAELPPILLTPIQGSTPIPVTTNSASSEDWQTFTSSTLGVTIKYPSDWSEAEEKDGVTFTAPTGAIIQLKDAATTANNNEFRVANQYCTSRTNEHGQSAEICADNASFIYTAKFTLQKADGSTHWVTLITKTRTAGDIFEAMFNSLQPTS